MSRWRSPLFVPGDRADMIAKTPRWSPDAVIVDLEDAVATTAKEAARVTAVTAIAGLVAAAGTGPVLVRVNPVGSPWFAGDVGAAAASAATGTVLPKFQDAGEVAELAGRLADAGRADMVVVVGLESALGIADARPLLAAAAEAGVVATYFGAEDYIADVGGRRHPDGVEVLAARSHVVLAARLAGVVALDQVVVAVHDDERFRADAAAGVALGFQGKICIHPRQVALANEAFTPSAEDVAHARAVVAAGAAGTGVVDGEMVDDVHVKMARRLLERAGAAEQ